VTFEPKVVKTLLFDKIDDDCWIYNEIGKSTIRFSNCIRKIAFLYFNMASVWGSVEYNYYKKLVEPLRKMGEGDVADLFNKIRIGRNIFLHSVSDVRGNRSGLFYTVQKNKKSELDELKVFYDGCNFIDIDEIIRNVKYGPSFTICKEFFKYYNTLIDGLEVLLNKEFILRGRPPQVFCYNEKPF